MFTSYVKLPQAKTCFFLPELSTCSSETNGNKQNILGDGICSSWTVVPERWIVYDSPSRIYFFSVHRFLQFLWMLFREFSGFQITRLVLPSRKRLKKTVENNNLYQFLMHQSAISMGHGFKFANCSSHSQRVDGLPRKPYLAHPFHV